MADSLVKAKLFPPACFRGTRKMSSSTVSYVILVKMYRALAASSHETLPFDIKII